MVDTKHPLRKLHSLFSDAMALIDMLTTLDWEVNQFVSVQVPPITDPDRKNAWMTYLKSQFEAIVVPASATKTPLSIHLNGKLAKTYVGDIANDFLLAARTALKAGPRSFPELLRPLFRAYKITGRNVLGLNSHYAVNPQYQGMAFYSDFRLDSVTDDFYREMVTQRTFFRVVGDHLHLPSFEDAMNDYTLPPY